jgi:hypothetical protein
MAEIKRAIEAFAFTDHTGVPRVVTPGVLMSDEDPDYKGKESLFESVEVAAARPGIQAAGDSELAHFRAQDAAAELSESAPHFPDQEWVDNLPAQPEPDTAKRSVRHPRRR